MNHLLNLPTTPTDIDASWERVHREYGDTSHIQLAQRRLGVANLKDTRHEYRSCAVLAEHAEKVYALAEIYKNSRLRRAWARFVCLLTGR